MLGGAGRSQGVGEAAAAVAPVPDLDLLVVGLGHEPYQLPPVRMDGSTRGLSPGINPDSHPWADAADGGPEAR